MMMAAEELASAFLPPGAIRRMNKYWIERPEFSIERCRAVQTTVRTIIERRQANNNRLGFTQFYDTFYNRLQEIEKSLDSEDVESILNGNLSDKCLFLANILVICRDLSQNALLGTDPEHMRDMVAEFLSRGKCGSLTPINYANIGEAILAALEEFDPESWQRDCVHRAWSHVVSLFLQFAIPICADEHLTKLLEKATLLGTATISRKRGTSLASMLTSPPARLSRTPSKERSTTTSSTSTSSYHHYAQTHSRSRRPSHGHSTLQPMRVHAPRTPTKRAHVKHAFTPQRLSDYAAAQAKATEYESSASKSMSTTSTMSMSMSTTSTNSQKPPPLVVQCPPPSCSTPTKRISTSCRKLPATVGPCHAQARTQGVNRKSTFIRSKSPPAKSTRRVRPAPPPRRQRPSECKRHSAFSNATAPSTISLTDALASAPAPSTISFTDALASAPPSAPCCSVLKMSSTVRLPTPSRVRPPLSLVATTTTLRDTSNLNCQRMPEPFSSESESSESCRAPFVARRFVGRAHTPPSMESGPRRSLRRDFDDAAAGFGAPVVRRPRSFSDADVEEFAKRPRSFSAADTFGKGSASISSSKGWSRAKKRVVKWMTSGLFQR